MELIIEKLRKIKALAERGAYGEMQTAKLLLEKLLAKHKLTIDDLTDSEKRERCFLAKQDNEKAALIMCFYKIIGADRRDDCYSYKHRRGKIYIMLTDYEFAELSMFYEFHKRNINKEFKKMREDFQKSYQYKHKLYSCTEVGDAKVLSEDEIKTILKYANEMEDVSFYRAIEQ